MADDVMVPVRETVFTGLGVSSGIGIGTAHVRESGVIQVPEYRIPAKRLAAEKERFREAVERARKHVAGLRAKLEGGPGRFEEDLGPLLDAYYQMLTDSRLVRGVLARIANERINAEAAVQEEVAAIGESFKAMDDAYIAGRLDDIRGVANRLVRSLMNKPYQTYSTLPRDSVVVAEELTPADTARLNPHLVAGIATVLGGTQGHTAIMARALEIPTVLGVAGILEGVRHGDTVIVDGDNGRVIVNPEDATLRAYEARRVEMARERRVLSRMRRVPAVTRDGTDVTLMANVELPIEVALVHQMGAAGIGLLRSEFMYMNREDIPPEEEVYETLRDIISVMEGKPVTVRILDVGGEKTTDALMGDYAGSASSPLGLRGIRLLLKRRDLLESQFRVILRAATEGNVRIMLPMVTTVGEVRKARQAMKAAAESLKEQGIAVPDPLPPVGIMIEIPAAALAADGLARVSDFFSIGSNDLTMYTLAADRGDEQVAHLYNPLHPAVLRLIRHAAEAARHAGIPVSLCGEIAGDPRYTALLLGLGILDLSMIASKLPRVKQRVRALDLPAATRRAQGILDQGDPGRIAMMLDDFNALF
jgi:phosphotransferase system enzyme I (PtsI)